MKKIILLLTSSILLFSSCKRKSENTSNVLGAEEIPEIQSINTLQKSEGLNLLKNNCFSCHNPNSESHDNMLAPPLAGIKHKYKQLYTTEELFIAQMSDFVNNPTKENSIMKGPVKRFGLMPKTPLKKSEIQEIVKFIYKTELPKPKWFKEHFEEKHNIEWEKR
ncbi:hypothetical protein CW751_00290 [Brumimicrobium salinarum]|uniref:Cytochrome c domain-containing protein n=1 Tax=Brumimicrobium salinarum TaxID=2058658 RepID=A0A2I0R5F5_9FLAO|nr:c-type cytochrome [Brumimicrobium salinarum]PKR81814.1 hypothetical protein CW751_00290 [Brumimicrobium salinarum]